MKRLYIFFILIVIAIFIKWFSPLIDFWNKQTTKLGVIIAIIALILTSIYRIIDRRRQLRLASTQKPFPYTLISGKGLIKELPLKSGILSATVGKIEPYVEKENLRNRFGANLVPNSRRLLLYGPSGVGKTREAVEIILRLNNLNPRNCYFAKRSINIPSELSPLDPFRNIVLFVDDLVVSSEKTVHHEEDNINKDLPTIADRLKETIRFFENIGGKGGQIDVIITMLTEEYQVLKDESSEIIEQFLVLDMEEATAEEKATYIKNVAYCFGFKSLLEIQIQDLVSASRESFGEIYNFFAILKDIGKNEIDDKDVVDFKNKLRTIWTRDIYPSLTYNQKLLFQALSKLERYSIPIFQDVVEELYLFIHGGYWLFTRTIFKKAISKLDKRWLRLARNEIYCHESRLFLDEHELSKSKEDLQVLSKVFESLGQKKKYENYFYQLMEPLAHALHKHDMYLEAIKFYDRIIELPIRVLPNNSEVVKSSCMFYKGHAYYSLGKEFWKIARECYENSIAHNAQNLYAKHALATLYNKQGLLDKAIELLNEITQADSEDILAFKTKLEILSYAGNFKEAKQTYRDIYRLLDKGNLPKKNSLSAEFALVRFSSTYGELLRQQEEPEKAEKRFNKTIAHYENLINRISPELRELKAIVMNAYSCFLYDVLERTDSAIVQLEKANQIVPHHTHTLHKLASIYIEESDVRTMEKQQYLQKAKVYLKMLLDIDPFHNLGKLSLVKLNSQSIVWDNLSEKEFWKKVSESYEEYCTTIEPENALVPSKHNSVVHHTLGCFLWRVEAESYKKRLTSKPQSIPSVIAEFTESIKIEQAFRESLPTNIRDHLILAYFTLGAYYMTVPNRTTKMMDEGQIHISHAVMMAREANNNHVFYAKNSYVESFVGKVLLNMGEEDHAKNYFKSATKKYEKNWRAWWFLGRIYEHEKKWDNALECFEKSAEGQKSPELFGALRSIIGWWIKEKGAPNDLSNKKFNYSKRAYELDPEGTLNPKNLSDYGYDLYKIGKSHYNVKQLEEAKDLLYRAYEKYLETGPKFDANFPIWYAGESIQALHNQIDQESLMCFLKGASIKGTAEIYAQLRYKIREYCLPFWKFGKTINDDVVSEIKSCLENHPEHIEVNATLGLVLQRNRNNEMALPYLEKIKATKDTAALRALMDCYIALGRKPDAENISRELYFLLSNSEQKKLKRHASNKNLNCDFEK